MKKTHLLLFLAALSLPLSATQIYTQNFESAAFGSVPSEWSGTGAAVDSTGSFSTFGFGSQHLRNTASGSPQSTLTLTGLAAHSTITVSFDLIVWDSMDNFKFFTVIADGSTLPGYPLQTSNYFNNDPSGFDGPGTLVSGSVVDFSNPNFGFNSSFHDQGRRIGGITFAHTASTLTITFGYNSNNVTGSTDESWGIDNVVVSDNNVVQTSGVPEPSTIALAATALAAFALKTRRK